MQLVSRVAFFYTFFYNYTCTVLRIVRFSPVGYSPLSYSLFSLNSSFIVFNRFHNVVKLCDFFARSARV